VRNIINLIILSLLTIIIASTACASSTNIGSIIEFGGQQWRVLDVQGKNVLIISEQIIGQYPYHKRWEGITWEKCSLRDYLNNEYYSTKFTTEEKVRIVETRNSNPTNTWYGTEGGAESIDRVFLLSLDEVVRYFGDSGDLQNKKRWIFQRTLTSDMYENNLIESPEGAILNDRFNNSRIFQDTDGEDCVWWLRSPGSSSYNASCVGDFGLLGVGGFEINEEYGVRPAMWIKI